MSLTRKLRDLSLVQWDEGLGLGRVLVERGSGLRGRGTTLTGHKGVFLYLEEILDLLERGACELLHEGMSLDCARAYCLLCERARTPPAKDDVGNGEATQLAHPVCSFGAYRELKAAGYVVRRLSTHAWRPQWARNADHMPKPTPKRTSLTLTDVRKVRKKKQKAPPPTSSTSSTSLDNTDDIPQM